MEEYEKQILANDLCGRLAHSDTYYKLLNNANHNEIKWLNKHHFDYNHLIEQGLHLIEQGLALKSLEGMYLCMPNNNDVVENNVDIEQQMRKSSYDLLDCALKYVRDRMPKPTWDSVEKLKERGLAFDAPNN